jgi:hypothetical protein
MKPHKKIMELKSMKSHMEISYGSLIRKEGGGTLIKIPWPAKKTNSNFMHNRLLSSLLNIFHISLPFSRTHSNACFLRHINIFLITPPSPELTRMCSFASPPRNRPLLPTIWKQPCLGQGQKGVKSHEEISQRPKSMKCQK